MKKQDIESIAKKFALENITTDKSGEFDLVDLLEYGFKKGIEWADNNPKSPWIIVKDDLPCNHEELISLDDKRYTLYVVAVIHNFIIMSRMYKEDDKWYWENDEPTYWFQIPELPKE